MLPRKHRLKTKKDFEHVYDKGRKFRTKYFLLIVAPQKLSSREGVLELPRFGFVASAKVGKASKRNQAKRKLREIVRLDLPNLKKDFDAVFICTKPLIEAEFDDVKKLVDFSFKSLALYRF